MPIYEKRPDGVILKNEKDGVFPGVRTEDRYLFATCPSGPYTKDQMDVFLSITKKALREKVTKENVHQLAHAIERWPVSKMLHTLGILTVDKAIIDHTPSRDYYFRNWKAKNKEELHALSRMYRIIIIDGQAMVLFPQSYFVAEEDNTVFITGPYAWFPEKQPDNTGANVNLHLIRQSRSRVINSSEINKNKEFSSWYTTRHFHVSTGGGLCLGTELPLYLEQKRNNDIIGMTMTIESVLRSFDSKDPFIHLEDIIRTECVLSSESEASEQICYTNSLGSRSKFSVEQKYFLSGERKERKVLDRFRLMLTDYEYQKLVKEDNTKIAEFIYKCLKSHSFMAKFSFVVGIPYVSVAEAWEWIGAKDIIRPPKVENMTAAEHPQDPYYSPVSHNSSRRKLATAEEYALQILKNEIETGAIDNEQSEEQATEEQDDQNPISETMEWPVRRVEEPCSPAFDISNASIAQTALPIPSSENISRREEAEDSDEEEEDRSF